MRQILAVLGITAAAGFLLYLALGRKSAETGATISGGGETLELEPGTNVFTVDPETGALTRVEEEETSIWSSIFGGGDDLEPEYAAGEEPVTELYTEIPGELISYTGSGGWYEQRDIEDVLGWSQEEFLEQIQYIRTIPATERTWEQQYAAGYADDVAEAKRDVAYYDFLVRIGGGFDGVLIAPDWWTGSITEFQAWAKETFAAEYDQPSGSVAATASSAVIAGFDTSPEAEPEIDKYAGMPVSLRPRW